MAISHNLSVITDNLSGFDPVAGEVDGTTIGKDYIMWQVVQGLLAFDTNLQIITGGAPTPTFLQGVAGTLTTVAPAKSACTTTGTIRLYDTTDPGLAQATPNAKVIEFARPISNGYYIVYWIHLKHMISGGTLHSPSTTIYYNSYTNTEVGYQPYIWNAGSGSTATVMAQIPKVIFWKNSQGTQLIMAISKIDGAGRGYFFWHTGSGNGYKHNVGAINNSGLDCNVAYGFTGYGSGFTEGLSATSGGQYNSIFTNLSLQCSSGELPTNLFTFSAINNLIGGNLWLSSKNDTVFKIITDTALEGILLANPTAANYGMGVIHQFNTKWYLVGLYINDGRDNYRILFELGT